PDGKVRVVLCFRGDLARLLEEHGQMPLPPYIRREEGQSEEDRQRYQTVYAENPGAVAAPTAGLHFTPELLARIQAQGVRLAQVTLHVGYGTFAPVRVEDIREHAIHAEYLKVSEETAALVNETRAAGGRVWAVGTTSVRALEFAAQETGQVAGRSGFCDLYIYPGYQFRVVDNLITNFHLPQSSLLFLVSALVGRERILAAYEEAVEKGYRFYSYGDAMALITRHPRG
ncbi:MAG: tRNA preQ1(34) S-adenosylmethionine ribosyltransferase-isomerase QueA, partial [Desulfurivibrionaceae bacterium]